MPSLQRWADAATLDAPKPPRSAPPSAWTSLRVTRHARTCAPEHAPHVFTACRTDRSVLPRWHQDDRGRQNAGRGVHIAAPAGAYAGLRVWWGREHWLTVVVPVALALHAPTVKAHKVNPDTFRRWAIIESGYVQDQRTGRRLIVRPDVVASVMGMCARTVQNCRALARTLGLLVDVMPGRMLSLEECLRARRAGSPQRGLSNESALVIPNPIAPHVDFCTPTRGSSGEMKSHLPHSSPRSPRKRGRKDAAARRRPDKGCSLHPGVEALARDLTRALPWLAGEGPRRLGPALRRFAATETPWTADDLLGALHTRALRTNRPMPTSHAAIRTRPAALLAAMLREIDENQDRYLPWPDTDAHPTPPPEPCDSPDCDHGWIDTTDTRGYRITTKCPTCHPAVRRATEDAPLDEEPPF